MDFPVKDEIKAFLVRLWFAGLICYFVLWGTNISNDYLDLLFLLPLAHFLCDFILTNNIIKLSFKTRLQLAKSYGKMTWFQRIKSWLYAFLECFLTVFLVIALYQLINKGIIQIKHLNPTAVPLPVEPFLYAVIYVGIYYLFYILKFKVVLKFLQGGIDYCDI